MASTQEQATTDMPTTYTDASTQRVTAENHGFLFQHHSEFAADVNAFLAEAG